MVNELWSFIGCLSGMLLLSPGEAQVISWGHDCYGLEELPPDPTSLIALSDGDIAWGDNTYGQTNVPAGLGNALAVYADGSSSFALCEDGTLAAWGHPLPGQSAVLPLLMNVSFLSVHWGVATAVLGDGPPSGGVPLRHPAWTDAGFSFEFRPPRKSVYAVEFTDSLIPPVWTTLPLVRGDGLAAGWIDPVRSGSGQFYRVRKW